MSKMKELSMVIDELIACGNGLIHAAEALREAFSSTEDESTEKAMAEEKSVSPANEEPEQATEDKSYTKEEVRKILSAKSTSEEGKYKVKVRELVKKFANGGTLADVDASDYESLIKAVEEIR